MYAEIDDIKSTNQQDLERRLAILCAEASYDYYAICSVAPSEFIMVNGLPKKFRTNYPGSWIKHYIKEKLYEKDPVLRHARSVSYAISWDAINPPGGLLPSQKRILNDARDFGLRSGVCFGVHNLDGSVQIVSLASETARPLSDAMSQNVMKQGLRMAQIMAASAYDQTIYENELSSREAECLTWAALGKSSADIGEILGISANTIDFHLKRAMKKLQVNSRCLAVVKAIRLDLIHP